MIGDKLGIDNYPIFEKEYEDYGTLQTEGINSYMIKFFDVKNPNHNHFASLYNGVFDDPDTSTKNNRWWERDNQYTSSYYSFTPKY